MSLERLDLLDTAQDSSPDGAEPLQVQKRLPADYDWTKAESINFSVDGPKAYGARVDVDQVLAESARHPSGSYLFGQAGWMDAVGRTTREPEVVPDHLHPRPGVMAVRGRTVLRRIVLGAFSGVVVVIVLLVGEAVLSIAGLSFDPHGYGMFAGILLAAVLVPVALTLWVAVPVDAARRRLTASAKQLLTRGSSRVHVRPTA